jgi:hypothetical protein
MLGLKLLYVVIIAVVFAQGLLMLFFPHAYVGFSNWWYRTVGSDKRLSVATFARWHRRLAGLVMLIIAVYLAVMMLWRVF